MSFSAELDRFMRDTVEKTDRVYRAIGLQMFGQIMERTPVDTGRLRGNWQTTISNPASGELDVTSSNMAQAQLSATVNGVTIRDTIYFTNNLPYALAIEHGHSLRQAPQGMVKVTVAEFDRKLSKIARGV